MYSFDKGSFPVTPMLDTKKALLLIDLQNDFVSPSGNLHVPNVAEFLPNIPRLASKFRDTGQVIWVGTEYVKPRPTISEELGSYTIVLKEFLEPGHEQVSDEELDQQARSGDASDPIHSYVEVDGSEPEAFLAPKPSGFNARCCVPATAGFELPQLLASAVHHEDKTLIKSEYSAFQGTSLLSVIRMKLITELYLCGSLSNVSVYATALDAVKHGLAVTIVEDCVGYLTGECHEEAMRQMADAMGANGVDCQELIDDLDGMLGAVLIDSEGNVNRNLGVLAPDAATSSDDLPTRSRTWDWIENLERTSARSSAQGAGVRQIRRDPQTASGNIGNESSVTMQRRISDTPDSLSPPRKRSTGELDLEEQEPAITRTLSRRRSLYDTASANENRTKPSRIRVRRHKEPDEKAKDFATDWTPLTTEIENRPRLTSDTPKDGMVATFKASSPTTDWKAEAISRGEATHTAHDPAIDEIEVDSNPASPAPDEGPRIAQRLASPSVETQKWQPKKALGPDDFIGEGDSHVIHDFIPADTAAQLFSQLKRETAWRKMHHRGGDVPRLVAVQGEMNEDGSIPIYRHPADESPPLLAFSTTVQSIRKHVEKVLQQPVNHVLIQLYRDSSDNISEHSDKTLDIFRGSNIVNYSIGAQRVMTLRTKKDTGSSVDDSGSKNDMARPWQGRGTAKPSTSLPNIHHKISPKRPLDAPNASASTPELHRMPGSVPITKSADFSNRILPSSTTNDVQQRNVQRIQLPHNSLFILGHKTNQSWLHGVRPDKRREADKIIEELAFNGERISLTFRHISTFINPAQGTIWGQGATAKNQSEARKILKGANANREVELMIRAFGQENHQSRGFNWDEYYGHGFDVVDCQDKKPEIATG